MGDWHYSPSINRWPLQVTFFNSKVEYSIYPILPVITSLYSQNGNLGELGGGGADLWPQDIIAFCSIDFFSYPAWNLDLISN